MYVNRIYFCNFLVARNVVERQHTLNGAQLEVCLYTPVPPMSPSRQNSEQERGITPFTIIINFYIPRKKKNFDKIIAL